MKKHILYIVALSLLAAACGDNEGILAPSGLERDWLVVEDSQDELTHERYLIFQQTGIPIYINDTIGSTERIDYRGLPYTYHEILKVFYNPGYQTPATNTAHYFLLDKRDDREAILSVLEFLSEEVLPLIPQNIYVPSILLVDSLKTPLSGYIAHKGLNAVVASRVTKFPAFNAAAKTVYKSSILRAVASGAILGTEAEWLAGVFYPVSTKVRTDITAFYDRYDYQLVNATYPKFFNYGFFEQPKTGTMMKSPTQTKDVNDFVEAVFSYTLGEFTALYGSYAPMMTKFNLMRDKLIAYGFEFE